MIQIRALVAMVALFALTPRWGYGIDCPKAFRSGLDSKAVSSTKRSIPTKRLNMAQVDGYVRTETSVLLEAVQKLGLDPERLLFRGFNGANAALVKKKGTDLGEWNTLWAYTQQEFRAIEIQGGETSLFDYAHHHDKPAIVVYDRDQMSPTSYPWQYEFNDPANPAGAVKAICFLDY